MHRFNCSSGAHWYSITVFRIFLDKIRSILTFKCICYQSKDQKRSKDGIIWLVWVEIWFFCLIPALHFLKTYHDDPNKHEMHSFIFVSNTASIHIWRIQWLFYVLFHMIFLLYICSKITHPDKKWCLNHLRRWSFEENVKFINYSRIWATMLHDSHTQFELRIWEKIYMGLIIYLYLSIRVGFKDIENVLLVFYSFL